MEDVGGGSLIGKTPGGGRPRVRRFFRGVEDQAPGGGDDASRRRASGDARGRGARRDASRARTGPSPEEVRSGADRVPPDPVERATEALEAMGDAPDKREDYGGWLQHQKAKWKVSRLKRKRRRAEEEEALVRASGAVGVITPGGRGPRPRLLGPGGLGAFVESRERTLARSPWHVIQVEPAPGPPGRFHRAWVLAAGSMHAVPLKIARRLSVAMRAPDREGDLGVGGKRRVAAILPRGAKAEHVYEVSMEESDFVSGLEVMDLLANPNVVGVFERHVPLLEAAVQKIGCVATLRRDADAGAGAVTQYDLDALEMRTAAECGYLPLAHAAKAKALTGDMHGMLRHVSLYHARTKDKGVYALHTPATNAAVLVVVAPGVGAGRGRDARARAAAREVTATAVDRFAKIAAGAAAGESESAPNDANDAAGATADPSALSAKVPAWTVEYVKSDEDAGAALSRRLTAFWRIPRVRRCAWWKLRRRRARPPPRRRRRRRTATRGRRRSSRRARPRPRASPRGDRARQRRRLGHARARVAKQRRAIGGGTASPLPAIGSPSASRSRGYAHVPIGNLGTDWCLHTADTFFARALRDSGQLLWTGLGGAPDLGEGASDASLSGLDDALQTVRAEVTAPGAYRCVCVELKAHHLAVCAIANAHLLNDLEQGALLGYDHEVRGRPAENPAFEADTRRRRRFARCASSSTTGWWTPPNDAIRTRTRCWGNSDGGC